MSKFSIGIAQDLMVERFISNLKVKRTRSGYAINKDKQQHGISADLLALKYGIVMEKGKCTL